MGGGYHTAAFYFRPFDDRVDLGSQRRHAASVTYDFRPRRLRASLARRFWRSMPRPHLYRIKLLYILVIVALIASACSRSDGNGSPFTQLTASNPIAQSAAGAAARRHPPPPPH